MGREGRKGRSGEWGGVGRDVLGCATAIVYEVWEDNPSFIVNREGKAGRTELSAGKKLVEVAHVQIGPTTLSS